MNKPKVMTVDLETETLDPFHTKILLIAYRYDGVGEVQQIKVYDNEKLNNEFIANLADPSIIKRGHNVSFDLLCLSGSGIQVRGPIDDTRILAYLENPSQELDLKGLVERKLKRAQTRLKDFGKVRVKKSDKELDLVKCGKVWVQKEPLEKYNKQDVVICDELRKELVSTDWYKKVEQPLSSILLNAEVRGIQLDIPYFKELSNEFEEKIQELKKTIEGTVGLGETETFNPNSPVQVKEVFKSQGVNLTTTDKHTLKKLAWGGNDLAKQLLGFRSLSKLRGTYITPFLETCDQSGRIHGRFNQAGRESLSIGDVKGTATGRLSSSDPNLQNIPDRTEEGRKIRKGIIPTSGYALIDSDLKQIEPRLVAHYTQSKRLLDAFNKGLDTHAIMGAGIFNKRSDALSTLERFIGKTSWLATVYGCYYPKLRKIVEINSDDPVFYDDEFYKKVQDAFWKSSPEILSWREQHICTTRATGFIETIGGRRIKIPGISSRNQWERQDAERLAVNYLIQGSAADIMKMIMVAWDGYEENQSHLLAVVHDEILSEVLVEDAVRTRNNLDFIMSHTTVLKNVPMAADTKVINNWSEK